MNAAATWNGGTVLGTIGVPAHTHITSICGAHFRVFQANPNESAASLRRVDGRRGPHPLCSTRAAR